MQTIGMMSQERLMTANRKSYMLRRLAQQRMTLGNLEWPFHGCASRAICAVAELLVVLSNQN